jgi:integrase
MFLYGDAYHDYGLLICLPNGDPIEPKLLLQKFTKWQKRIGKNFPPIVVHGLRHSSTNFKLSISDGDFKSIQGDFGWASIQMVEHYSHVEDDRRKELNTKFEQQFYKADLDDNSDNSVVYTVLNNPNLRQKLLLALLSDNAQ